MLDELADIGLNKIFIQFEKGNYPKVVSDGNNYLKEEFIKPNHKLKCATLMIKSYILLSDYKRASIVESDYYDLVKEDYLNESLEFSNAALELYKKTTKFSLIMPCFTKGRGMRVDSQPYDLQYMISYPGGL